MRRSTQNNGKMRKWLRLPVVLLLILFLSIAPTKPSQAIYCFIVCAGSDSWAGTLMTQIANFVAKVAKFAEETAKNSAIYSTYVATKDAIDEYKQVFQNTMADVTGNAVTLEELSKGVVEPRVMQGLADHHKETTEAARHALIAAKHASPTPQSQGAVCNTISSRQGVVVGRRLTEVLTRSILAELDEAGRGPDAYFNGPSYAYEEKFSRCPGSSDTLPRTDRTCAEPPPGSGLPGAPDEGMYSLIDTDVNIMTISGGPILEMPPIVEKTVTLAGGGTMKKSFPIPDYEEDPDAADPGTPRLDKDGNPIPVREQQNWIAARNFCYQAMGPRPSPPYGDKMNTPQGIVEAARYNHCKAIQSVFLKQCARRVARLTRPNCNENDESSMSICTIGEMACQAAVAAGVELPDGFNCNKGQSPYQLEYLSHAVCFTNQSTLGAAGTGMNHGEIAGKNDKCAKQMAAWKAQLASEDSALLDAMKGLDEVRDCWTGDSERKPAGKANAAFESGVTKKRQAEPISYRREGTM